MITRELTRSREFVLQRFLCGAFCSRLHLMQEAEKSGANNTHPHTATSGAPVTRFAPRKPEAMEVTAPNRKASVEKAPLYMEGARRTPVASSTHSRLKPSSEPSSKKMTAEKNTCGGTDRV